MEKCQVCVDAGLVIRLVAFPEDVFIQGLWERWEREDWLVHAPGLLLYEVTNVLHRYERNGYIHTSAAVAALEAVLSLPVQLAGDGDLHREAMAMARELSLPAAYDAHYLALARRLEIELWTTDGRLAQTCREHGLDWVHPVALSPQP